MKNLLIYIAALLAFTTASAQVQNPVGRGIDILSYDAEVNGGQVDMDIVLGYSRLMITPQEHLALTPMVIKGFDTVRLDPVNIDGRTRSKVISRERALNNVSPYEPVPVEEITLTNRELRQRRRAGASALPLAGAQNQTLRYHSTVPYQPWMDGAEVCLLQEVQGCADHASDMMCYHLGEIRRPVVPVIAATILIVPEVELVKRRSDKLTAHINFPQAKSEIYPNLGDNKRELNRIHDLTRELLKDSDVTVDKVLITGYASPEGNYNYNTRLSQSRVESLKEDIALEYKIDRSKITAVGAAEDWDSLRSWIAASNIDFRTQLLNIIDNTYDPDARDNKIRALDGGRTYNYLLNNIYPQLRRVDYEVDYTVAGFTVERGREVIKTAPQNMSLHELYIVALSYPEQSAEYNEAFEIMARRYPNDVVANNNMAVISLQKGNYETARRYLERTLDDPRCKNNMGVVMLREGNVEGATEYFRQAAYDGIREAEFNLENINALH